MHITARTGRTVTSKDHFVCAVFAVLIYFSVTLMLIPNMLWSMVGAWLVWRNWTAFNAYCEQRRDGLK